MAFRPNKTAGKAIADIKALYFMKHVNGVEPDMLEVLDENNPKSADWFNVLSLRGTVTCNQDNPTIEKILVDQFDAPIGITTDPGDFTFEAQLPSLAKKDIEEWLGEELVEYKDNQGDPITIGGRQVLGFNLDGTIYELSVMIQTRTNATIVFTNAQVSFVFSKEDKVFLFKVAGQILAAENPENKMIYIATEAAHFPVHGVTLNKETTSIVAGENETLVATVAPETATDKSVTWSSSDEAVATVDANGKVVGVAAGSANITVTCVDDNTKTATCAVTVTSE